MLKGKVALITGAGGEIGRASALLFAAEGADIVVCDLSTSAAEETAHQVERTGRRAIAFTMDIGDRSQVNAAVAQALSHFKVIDCAFNNAGVNLPADADWNMDAFDTTMSINATGTMNCLTAQIEFMTRAGHGSIVNNASVMGVVGSSRQPGYAASKHAVIGLTRTAAIRYAKTGVRVNAICPGSVRTAMTEKAMNISEEVRQRILSMSPMGRLVETREVAEAALWLCSDRSSFVNGVALPVDGGFTAS